MNYILVISMMIILSCKTNLDLANRSPIFVSSPITKTDENGFYFYQIEVSDPENDSLNISPGNLPTWLTYDPVKQELSGLPTVSGIGNYSISIQLSDGINRVTQAFDIEINYLISEPPIFANVNSEYTYQVKTLSLPQSIVVNLKPNWLNFDSVLRRFSGTPMSSDKGSAGVEYTITDATQGILNYSFQIDIDIRFSKFIESPESSPRLHYVKSLVQSNTDSSYISLSNHEYHVPGTVGRNTLVTKTNRTGSMIWQSLIFSPKPESIKQLTDGNVLFTGGNSSSAIVGVINQATGQLDWSANFGVVDGGKTKSVIETSDNNIVFVGSINYRDDTIYNDVWLVKIDMTGTVLWEKTFGGDLPESGIDVKQLSDGFLILGQTASIGKGQNDIYLMKTDLNGNLLWEKTFGGSKNDKAEALMTATGNSGFYIIGSTNSKGAGSSDAWLLKINTSGDLIWDKTFGTENFDRGLSFDQTNDGGLIFTVEERSQNNLVKSLRIIRTDASGEIIWEKLQSGAERIGYTIKTTFDGGFIIGGLYRDGAQQYASSWILKTDSEGNVD